MHRKMLKIGLKMDSLFKIYWFEVKFQDKDSSKTRPIVTIIFNNEALSFEVLGVYSIKDKYKTNPYYKSFMYEVKDWQQANFKEPSFINVARPMEIPFTALIGKKYGGSLTTKDVQGLMNLYNNYWLAK